MRRLFLVLPAVALAAVAGCSSGGHPASAPSQGTSTGTTSPSAAPSSSTPASSATLDVNNTAGWNVSSPTATLTTVAGSFTLSGASFSSHGSIGLQLCNSKTDYAVQFGAVPTASGWTIGYFAGQLASAGGIGGDPCVGNQFLKPASLTAVGTTHTGVTLRAQISEQSSGQFVFTYATSDATSFSHRATLTAGQFDEAAASASYPGIDFRGALVNRLTSFTGVTASAAGGVSGGLASFAPAQVSSSGTGKPPIVLSASALTPSTGRAPSSFDIVGGTPKL